MSNTKLIKYAITNKLTVNELSDKLTILMTKEEITIEEATDVLMQYQDYLISSSEYISNNLDISI